MSNIPQISIIKEKRSGYELEKKGWLYKLICNNATVTIKPQII